MLPPSPLSLMIVGSNNINNSISNNHKSLLLGEYDETKNVAGESDEPGDGAEDPGEPELPHLHRARFSSLQFSTYISQ